MAKFLVIVRDAGQNVVPNATVTCGNATGTTDATGTVTINPSNVLSGQTTTVTSSAQGYTTQSTKVLAAQYTQVVTLTLTIIPSSSLVQVTVTNGTSALPGALVFVAGVKTGVTDANGQLSFQLKTATAVVEVAAAGYNVFRQTINAAAPDKIVLTAKQTPGKHVTFASSPPGAAIQVDSEVGVLGPDGVYTTTRLYVPGTYQVVLGSGPNAVATTITVD